MRITRLHIILGIVVCVGLAFAWWRWQQLSPAKNFLSTHAFASSSSAAPEPLIPPVPSASDDLLSVPAKSVSTPVSRLKANETMGASSSESSGMYEVKEGDTLWKIARDNSPVHQGPGWVAIYRANQTLITDYDHVPSGTMLRIPQKRSDYNMRYWKPRRR